MNIYVNVGGWLLRILNSGVIGFVFWVDRFSGREEDGVGVGRRWIIVKRIVRGCCNYLDLVWGKSKSYEDELGVVWEKVWEIWKVNV